MSVNFVKLLKGVETTAIRSNELRVHTTGGCPVSRLFTYNNNRIAEEKPGSPHPLFEAELRLQIKQRTRLITDVWTRPVRGRRKIINLGSGMDVRPWALADTLAAHGVREVVEVDKPRVVALKKKVLGDHGQPVSCVRPDELMVRHLPMDLKHLPTADLELRPGDRPLWCMEGLLEFMDRAKQAAMIRAVAGHSAGGVDADLVAFVLQPTIFDAFELDAQYMRARCGQWVLPLTPLDEVLKELSSHRVMASGRIRYSRSVNGKSWEVTGVTQATEHAFIVEASYCARDAF
ncbi:hypothetical protein DIPPA_16490 [Diplonema papillatum]|nr:hypothetical protein DIPPA_16490 [Diplonema papillatum]